MTEAGVAGGAFVDEAEAAMLRSDGLLASSTPTSAPSATLPSLLRPASQKRPFSASEVAARNTRRRVDSDGDGGADDGSEEEGGRVEDRDDEDDEDFLGGSRASTRTSVARAPSGPSVRVPRLLGTHLFATIRRHPSLDAARAQVAHVLVHESVQPAQDALPSAVRALCEANVPDEVRRALAFVLPHADLVKSLVRRG